MTKWIALALLVVGLLLVRRAYSMTKPASFESGSFLGALFCSAAGFVCVIASMAIFAIAGFMAL